MSNLRGISSMATRQILAELAEAYAISTAEKVAIESVGGVDAARRIRAGEAFDFAVLALDALAQLERDDHIVAGSILGFAQSPMAMAVRAGARRPAISDEAAVRAAMQAARAIGISTGPSGNHVLKLVRDWGLEQELSKQIVQAQPGVPVAALLAGGEADLGFQQLSELLAAPGIEIVGVLPQAIQPMTVFAAGICKAAANAAGARAFMEYLASDRSADAKRRHGMTPA
ncbi:substrate-binding domain-containing protein [Bradyrhizobium sp.]|uniref:substrate-binding domain-containing protein n=1 Tax=Bradyrhizobium sp. TaxID=376 RepID=UPI001D5D4EAA|nr:substrate-binding domain-containing protein [Bradyrhizobium sp.]MBV8697157.1 substrate-binding domain-containing protein [Bradyrhizobium sp.]MBV8916904.1 substrate-binding domain-containing protein [Bradyrhizobium sp.]MBV9981671.1 substrate-binding domain-containing protein [Bradyrhizobium sp.]